MYKKGNKHNSLNSRPISLTNSFCKSFRHINFIKILAHLFLNKLISPKKFDILPDRSSCFQLLDFLHSWLMTFLSKKSTKVIYTDIKKIFDSVFYIK